MKFAPLGIVEVAMAVDREIGKIRNSTAKKKSSINPIQKSGVENVKNEVTRKNLSVILPLREAANAPIIDPTRALAHITVPMSSTVRGANSSMRLITGGRPG